MYFFTVTTFLLFFAKSVVCSLQVVTFFAVPTDRHICRKSVSSYRILTTVSYSQQTNYMNDSDAKTVVSFWSLLSGKFNGSPMKIFSLSRMQSL